MLPGNSVPITRSNLTAKINLLCPPATPGSCSLDVAAQVAWAAKGACMFPWTDGLPRSTSISRLGRCEVSQPAVSPAQAHTEPPGLPHPALHQHETAFPRVLLHGGRHLGPPAPASCWADHIPPPDGPHHHAPPQGLGCGWVPPGSQLTPGQHRSHGRRIWTCRDTGTGRATPRIRGGMGGTTDQGLQGAESEMGETPWGSQQRVGLPTRGHAGPSGHSTRAPVLRAARQAPLDLLHVFHQPVLCAPDRKSTRLNSSH